MNDFNDLNESWAHVCCTACYELCVEVLDLTRVDKFESFSGGLSVWVKLQPQMVGGADKSQAQHGWTCESSQHMGCVVFTIIDLQVIRNNGRKSKADWGSSMCWTKWTSESNPSQAVKFKSFIFIIAINSVQHTVTWNNVSHSKTSLRQSSEKVLIRSFNNSLLKTIKNKAQLQFYLKEAE